MKKIEQNKIDAEFYDVMNNIFDTDMSDFKKVFEAGIQFAYDQNKKKKIYGVFNELGYSVDTKKILEIISNECEENEGIYDELYGVDNITFTNIKFNQDNAANREMTIIFSASENRGGDYSGNIIKIDSLGRVNVNIDDTPWESGGVETEITEIVMKYISKQKYK